VRCYSRRKHRPVKVGGHCGAVNADQQEFDKRVVG
jgi:hypothetical protein